MNNKGTLYVKEYMQYLLILDSNEISNKIFVLIHEIFDVKNSLIYNGIKSRGLYILRDMPKTESTERGKCFNFAIVPFAKICGKIASIMK